MRRALPLILLVTSACRSERPLRHVFQHGDRGITVEGSVIRVTCDDAPADLSSLPNTRPRWRQEPPLPIQRVTPPLPGALRPCPWELDVEGVLAPAERERLVRGAALVVEEPHVVRGELQLVLPTRVLAVNLAERRVVGTSLVARDLDGTEPFPAWPRVSVDGTHFRLTSADGGVASVELRPLLTAAERDQPRPIRWWRTRGHQLDVGLSTRTLEVAWASPPRPVESGLILGPDLFLATSREDPPLRVLVGTADAGPR